MAMLAWLTMVLMTAHHRPTGVSVNGAALPAGSQSGDAFMSIHESAAYPLYRTADLLAHEVDHGG